MADKFPFFVVAPLVALGSFFCDAATAQITPDSTLGNENSTIRQETIQGINSDLITGGATRGANLFHSFSEFNIPAGRGAYFANPPAIQNILTRVTGGNPSNILGTLGVLGNANLFLINPNGISFGSTARLDIKGSFVAATADSLTFGNNLEFSATNPQAPPLLNVNIPIGLRFRENTGDIHNTGNLTVGKDLTLQAQNLNLSGIIQAGGNLTLQAQDTVTVRDSVEQPFIAAAGNQLLIQGNESVDIFALNHVNSGLFSSGDLVLRSANTVGGDAHYWGGGNFRIEQLDGSLGNLSSPHDPIIRTTGDVFIGAYQGASLHIIAGGSVTIPGFILITGADPQFGLVENITLSNGQQITIDGRNNPTVDIRAGVNPEFIGVPFFQGSGNDLFFSPTPPPTPPTSAYINVGTIVFSRNPFDSTQKITGDVLLTNQYQPNPNLSSSQNDIIITPSNLSFGFIPNFESTAIDTSSFSSGGKVIIDSKSGIGVVGGINSFAFEQDGKGGDIIFNSVGDTFIINARIDVASSHGGSINIKANNLTLNNSSLLAGIRSELGVENAQAGDIKITVHGNATLTSDSSIQSNVESGGQGNAGNINFTADDSLSLLDGSFISTIVRRSTELSNGTIIPAGEGNSGNITIKASDINLSNVSEEGGFRPGIFTFVDQGARGIAGNIQLEATNNLTLSNSALVRSTLDFNAVGRAGNIEINAGSLSFENNALVISSTFGQGEPNTDLTGNAGNISIKVQGNATLVSDSGIQSNVESGGKGNAGNIDFRADSLSLLDGSFISTIVRRSTEPSNGTIIPAGEGNGGNITIKANDINLSGVSEQGGFSSGIFTFVDQGARGIAGNIQLEATNNLTLSNSAVVRSTLDLNAVGRGGNIEINAGSLSFENNALVISSTFGQGEPNTDFTGNAGNITINVQGNATLVSSGIQSDVDRGGKGNAGNINFTADSIFFRDFSAITSVVRGSITSNGTVVTPGEGNGGNITIKARDITLFGLSEGRQGFRNGISSSVGADARGIGGNIKIEVDNRLTLSNFILIDSILENDATGRAGNIEIQAGLLYLNNNSVISTISLGKGETNSNELTGNAGNITINVQGNATFISSGIETNIGAGGIGTAGNIDFKADSISLLDGGSIRSVVLGELLLANGTIVAPGQGNGGSIRIKANEINIDGFSSQNLSQINASVGIGTTGQAGSIDIESKTLNVKNGAFISAITEGEGDAGNIDITANNQIFISGIFAEVLNMGIGGISTITTNTGEAGDITINTPIFNISNGAGVEAFTQGVGNAGSITINAPQIVDIGQGSRIVVETSGAGNPGDINIRTNTLNIGKDAELSATARATATNRQGGNINLNTSNLNISGRLGIFAETQGISPAGNLTLNPNSINPNLNINFTDNGFISASTTAAGNGGNINISAPEIIDIQGEGRIIVETSGSGNAGRIDITAQTLNLANGVEISASTNGTGDAGDILLTIQDNLNLTNSAIASSTTPNSTGDGGNIIIDPDQVNLNNRAQISVNSQGQGDAGSIFLTANNLTLNNNSTISAATASGEGGNINLNIANLLRLRNNSPITATANGTGNGGNININTTFLVANQDSDITANAFAGRGGNINITTQALFFSPDSQITASSELGVEGVVAINTPEIDPSQGLLNLPETVVDPRTLINQNACQRGRQSEFTITGRGGLPSSPEQFPNSDEVEVGLVTPSEESVTRVTSPLPTAVTSEKIVPAQGWVRNEKGRIILVGYDPSNANIQRQKTNLTACQPR
ncbi:filamentous hemagglutinin N-terminal domain-containing protein [Aulosira sp. FACHB-615]|uniref:two-partner secretion domain-containing protein n=1 Tax=Aulosira sp. FACHB-615 TaxID=2692777 RepID=UPI0016869138|nr:filamentous hemagglutinin N-terminal domain-containing protein [Aulosira sp. FACHB-615]MBD2492516.1 filamentous hemagglutinin N-terminal domain-containing protein [Aulosira sp. FACHB-615]